MSNVPSLQELKKKFSRVIVKHLRQEKPEETCVVLIKDRAVYVGRSRCSKGDQFCKKRGRIIAIGRAWRMYELGGADLLGSQQEEEFKTQVGEILNGRMT